MGFLLHDWLKVLSLEWVARFGTRRNYKRETHLLYDFPPIISVHCPLYSTRRVQTLKIKTSSLLSLVVFVLVTFELSLCTAGSLFPISLFLTLLLIRKENQEWQSHLFPRPFPLTPTKYLKLEINEVAESFSSWAPYSESSSVWPQSLLRPGTA